MILSCCIWALNEPEAVAHQQLHDLGFTAFDIRPSFLRSEESETSRKDLGLTPCCIALSHEQPKGARIDTDNGDALNLAIEHMKDALEHAARRGLRWAYLVAEAPADDHAVERYIAPYLAIADYGQTLGIKVCIEHFPGTAFPTISSTLNFIEELDHDNLYLLLDIGHAQMSNEDPRVALASVGSRLGYVHLDDNDGIRDLHLALMDGVQTEASLTDLFQVLKDIDYDGPVSLEMHENLPNPLDAIDRSRQLVSRLIEQSQYNS